MRRKSYSLELGVGGVGVTVDRWQVSFTCEVDREVGQPTRPQERIGVDAGLHGTVLSSGDVIPTPRPLRAALRKLARCNRELARRQLGSQGWQETKVKLRGAHHGGHPRMARAVADAGMAELRRQLIYKCAWHGSRFVAAPRQFPSSKTCSRCGAVKATLSLWERVFRCEACGLVMDRDLNATKNLAALAAQVHHVAGSGPETQNARGRDVSPDAVGRTLMKREAGSSLIGVAPPLRKEQRLETVALISSNGTAARRSSPRTAGSSGCERGTAGPTRIFPGRRAPRWSPIRAPKPPITYPRSWSHHARAV